MKAGIKTTEFWAAAVVSATSLAALVGVIGPDEQTKLVEAGGHVIAGVREIVLGVTTAAPIVAYAFARAKVKVQHILSNPGSN